MSTSRPTFRVFVSSTFRDFKAERNILRERTFPNLRKFCERRGARFQAIDLRWGISPEAVESHQTVNICLEELYRCQRVTPRPNFIALLGDRYGWRPLPPQIFEDEFQQLLAAVSGPTRDQGISLLEQWYVIDENAVPLERVLQPKSPDSEFDEDTLRRILQGAALSLSAEQQFKYFESVTHQEVRHGILGVPGAEKHVFCYFRDLQTLPDPASDEGADFLDATSERDAGGNVVTRHDTKAHGALSQLKDHLEHTTFADQPADQPHVRRHKVTNIDAIPRYLEQLAADVETDLKQIIGEQLKALEDRDEDLAAHSRESDAHHIFGHERCQHFVGREERLQDIDLYIKDTGNHQPLVISGTGGSGKTALLAKASEIERESKASSVLTRFIGTSSTASDIRLLLPSMCQEITAEYGSIQVSDTESESSQTEENDVQQLVKRFEKCLGMATADKPLVVFLDALDQINPTDGAEYLSWIPWNELPEHVKLIVTVLEPESEQTNSPAATSYRVATGRVDERNIVKLDAMSREQGEQLLQRWLDHCGRRLMPWEYPEITAGPDGVRRTGRKLTERQADDVLDKFAKHGLPLWLKLAFEEAHHWHSYDKLPTGHDDVAGLSEDVAGILRDLFSRLEDLENHGEVFTKRALGYLAAGRRGLTEDELIDVLSQDAEVMDDFIARSPTEREKPPEERLTKLPVLIWSRLYSDLEPYLSERAAYGATVLNFYHRQVAEEVAKRYLSGDDRVHCHQHLAKYFSDDELRPYFLESLEEQRARARRLPPTPRPVNIRKVDELPYHVLQVAKLVGRDDPKAKEWDDVADLLTNWQFLEAKAEAQP